MRICSKKRETPRCVSYAHVISDRQRSAKAFVCGLCTNEYVFINGQLSKILVSRNGRVFTSAQLSLFPMFCQASSRICPLSLKRKEANHCQALSKGHTKSQCVVVDPIHPTSATKRHVADPSPHRRHLRHLLTISRKLGTLLSHQNLGTPGLGMNARLIELMQASQ